MRSYRAVGRSLACCRRGGAGRRRCVLARIRPARGVRPPKLAVHDRPRCPNGLTVVLLGRSLDADRPPAALVSRRLEEREAGPHRLRASVRAPDVQGLEERRARGAHVDASRRVGGQSNAYTTDDETVFWETVPAQYLPLVLWLEADRMATLRIDKDTFANEREVVKEERRMRIDNQPYGRLNEIIYDQAFTVHPYKHPTIGSMAGSRGGVGRRRARLLPDLLRAGERDAGARRRLRLGAGAAAGRRSTSGACRRPTAPVPRDIPKEPPQTQGEARHAAGAVAAAGGRRRVSHHLRRQPGLVSAAHRRRRCCPTARARASTRSWSTRSRWRVAAFGGGNLIEDPNLFYAVAIVQPGHTPEEATDGAHRGARSAEDRADHRARAAAREEPVRARLHPRPRVGPAEGAAARRTPSSSTTTSRRPTASSTSSRTSRPPTCSASRGRTSRRRTGWC